MKIWLCALADLSRDSGPSSHLRAQIDGFRERGHDVTAFVSAPAPSGFVDPAVVFVPRPALPTRRMRYASELASFQLGLLARMFARGRETGRPDVLLARHDVAQVAAVSAARGLGVPVVSEINGSLRYELSIAGSGPRAIATIEALERFAYRCSRRIIAVSEGIADHLVRDLGVDPERVRVCRNGTDVATMAGGDGRALRQRIGAGPREVVIGYVGGFQPHQGVRELVEAFGCLAERNEALRLLLVGDGPCAREVRSRLEAAPWAKRATFLGPVPRGEVPDCLAAMDICTVPRFDPRPAGRQSGTPAGSPLKLFEALAAGRPVLAGPLPDLRLVEKIGAGICADTSTPAAIAEALEGLCADEGQRAQMGRAGRCWALEHGSWEAAMDRVEAVLREAVTP
ncbi:MAG: glycosyltransferase family 4 protein [Deltaproteobacteria bacterium]|nr:glycosyltransferase family 4 protein [Deltaproteobacteria bacterium]MBW2444501.1 glycosyltransferase family 4 protein [Deltaproteobacteria bacterium]